MTPLSSATDLYDTRIPAEKRTVSNRPAAADRVDSASIPLTRAVKSVVAFTPQNTSQEPDLPELQDQAANEESVPRTTTATGRSAVRLAVVPADTPNFSPAYREFRIAQSFRKARTCLAELRSTIDSAACAVWIREFREVLRTLQSYLVSPESLRAAEALEATARANKWRELTRAKVDVLESGISDLERRANLRGLYAKLQRAGLNVFPVVSDEAANEPEEE